ncbi:hypothetical protein [Actinoplanes sp. G11-F43]|uniref:hypothetical protein n=1 Tax=Actinoplanes sp. G11-F43 TaxID=3424130 RepID=UPI003D34A814
MEQIEHPPAPPPGHRTWNGKTNGFSIAGLITACLGCVFGVVGLVVGVVTLPESRPDADTRADADCRTHYSNYTGNPLTEDGTTPLHILRVPDGDTRELAICLAHTESAPTTGSVRR